MTRDDHRVDRPFQSRARTGELGSTAPVRGPSERSGTRKPPVIDEETPAPPVEKTFAAELRALRAENDKFRGEMLAGYSQMRIDLRNDVSAPASRKVEALEHKLEETQFDLLKHVSKWKRIAVAALAIASALFGGNAVQAALGSDITEAAAEVGAKAAEAKAAELEAAHEATRQLAEQSARRIDGVEQKIDRVLAVLEERQPPPEPIVVPRKPKPR